MTDTSSSPKLPWWVYSVIALGTGMITGETLALYYHVMRDPPVIQAPAECDCRCRCEVDCPDPPPKRPD